jgi:hypothetical protein
MFDGASRVAVCRRRSAGVGEDAAAAGDGEDVARVVSVWALVEEVLLLLVLGGASGEGEEGETAMPKGVSSSFTLLEEEDATATFLVA